MTPTRLSAAVHVNGWETWIAEQEDGTFAGWACPAGESAPSFYVEDTREHAEAAALFHLARLSGHGVCTTTCGPWNERECIQLPNS